MSVGNTTKYDLYLKAAKTALKNANLLHDEASLLIETDHFARGFALCVLSLEESSKAYLYRYISLNFHNESKTLKLIHSHEKKLYQSQIILSTSLKTVHFFFGITLKLLDALKDERELDNLRNKLDNNKLELFEKGVATLRDIHKKKLDSLYVDIRDGKIIDPNKLLTKKQVAEIFDLVEVQFDIVDNVIKSKDDLLIQMWKLMPLSPFAEDNIDNFQEMTEEFSKLMDDMKNASNYVVSNL